MDDQRKVFFKYPEHEMKKQLIFIMILLLFVLLSFSQKAKDSSIEAQLKCDVLVKGTDFFYLLNVYPSKKINGLFHWEVLIENFKTGEIITRLRGGTMRGQENVFERGYRLDGSKIKITTSVKIKQPKITYHIQRTKGDKLIYSCKGEKEIIL